MYFEYLVSNVVVYGVVGAPSASIPTVPLIIASTVIATILLGEIAALVTAILSDSSTASRISKASYSATPGWGSLGW